MRKFRVGLVGCGGRLRSHVEALRQLDNCQIVASADPVADARSAFNEMLGVSESFENVTDMVRGAGVELVAVVTRTKWIYQPMMEAILAGVRRWCPPICERRTGFRTGCLSG